jgi:hypothetical protein
MVQCMRCSSAKDAKIVITHVITMQNDYFINYLKDYLFIYYLTKH